MPTITREALYDLVWSQPLRDLAKRFNLSDVGLKKVCIRLEVPTPYRGYWAKLAAGKRVFKTALPQRPIGISGDIQLGSGSRSSWPPDPASALAEPEPLRPEFPEPIETIENRVRKSVGKVSYLRTLDHTHREITKLLKKDQELREKQKNFAWYKPFFDSPFEQRRLKVLNSIFVGLARAGARPFVSDKAARLTGVTIGDADVRFFLEHPKARKPEHWDTPRTNKGKVDTLRLEIERWAGPERRTVWVDTETQKLEAHLTEIVVTLIVGGEAEMRRASFAHYDYILQRRQEARQELERRRVEAERKERERLAALERKRRETLIAQARAWRPAEDLRLFIGLAVERSGAVDANQDIRRWQEWALRVADGLDPLESLSSVADPLAYEGH